jgi:hypothetical protein
MWKKYILICFVLFISFFNEGYSQKWIVKDSILVFPEGFYSWLKRNNGGIDTLASGNVGNFRDRKVGTNQGIEVFDFNKDGLMDLTFEFHPHNTITREYLKGIFLQNKNGKYVLDTNYVIKGKGDMWYGEFADFNGDGLSDYMYLTSNYHGADSNRIYNTDMIGDNWPDRVFINNGKGFDTLSLDEKNIRVMSTYAADIDNDGADEIIASSQDKYINISTNTWESIRISVYKYDKKLKKFYEIEKNLSNLWNEKISPPISSYPVFNIVDAVNKNEFYALALDSLSNGYTIYDYSNFTLANYNFTTKKLNTFKINRDSILIPEKYSKSGADNPKNAGDDYFRFMVHSFRYANKLDIDMDGEEEIILGGFYQNNHRVNKPKFAYGWKVLGLNGKDLTSKFFNDNGIDRGVDLVSHMLDIDENNKGPEWIPGVWGLDPKYYIDGSPTLGYYYQYVNGKMEKKFIRNIIHETNKKVDSNYFFEMQLVKYPNYTKTKNALLMFDFWDIKRTAILYQATCIGISKPTFNTTKYSFCNGDSIKLSITNINKGDSIKWYYGTKSDLTNPSNKTFTDSTKLFVTRTDSVGCVISSDTIQIKKYGIPSAPTLSRDTANFLLSGAPGTTWYKDGSAITDTAQKYKPTTAGSYTAKTTTNGCTSVMSAAYYYLVTDIINLSKDEFIKLAPNPFINQLNFDFIVKGYQKLNIEVYDVATGSKVATQQNITAGTKIQLGQLARGTYIVRVTSNDNKIAQQFKMVKL